MFTCGEGPIKSLVVARGHGPSGDLEFRVCVQRIEGRTAIALSFSASFAPLMESRALLQVEEDNTVVISRALGASSVWNSIAV